MDILLLHILAYTIFAIIAYAIGSIPFGLLLCKITKKGDLRKIGSGNIGATNVLRTGDKKLALATLVLDSLKGMPIIFWLLSRPEPAPRTDYFNGYGFFIENQHTILLYIALAAILGHCFPIWLKFKGGKGVATTLGTLLAAVPFAGLAACGTWLFMAFAFRISSLSALTAMVIAPIVTFFVYGPMPAAICALISLLVFIRHKDNIKRLIKGEESKISFKKKEEET